MGASTGWDGEEAGARHGNIASHLEQGDWAGGADAYSVGGRIDLEGGGGGLIVEGYPANGVQVDEVRIDAGEGHGASSKYYIPKLPLNPRLPSPGPGGHIASTTLMVPQ